MMSCFTSSEKANTHITVVNRVGIVRDNSASASTTQGGRGGFISLIAPQDEIYTGCVRGDHGTLHPDPEANELWISCNSSFEVVILDLDLRDITGRIPMPNGGSTHSGAFVEYSADWEGEVSIGSQRIARIGVGF